MECQSQSPRGLRRRSAASRLLRSWVRIPLGAWMSVVSVVWCQVEVSATSWSLVLPTVLRRCVWPRNLKNEEAMNRVGSQRHRKKKNYFFLIYAVISVLPVYISASCLYQCFLFISVLPVYISASCLYQCFLFISVLPVYISASCLSIICGKDFYPRI